MKTVVITGISRGIGLATAKKFLAEGWRVIGTYLDSPVPLEHENLVTLQYDQSQPESIAQAADKIKELTPVLDALINNAGVLLDAHDTVADPDKVRKSLEVNVVGVIDLTERLLPLLNKDSHIVTMNSGYGSVSNFIHDDESAAGYRISKAALNMYTRHLSYRLWERGVIVSAIAPGWVQTDMGRQIATETDAPDRTPEQAAEDIFHLVDTVKETGHFWRIREKSDW